MKKLSFPSFFRKNKQKSISKHIELKDLKEIYLKRKQVMQSAVKTIWDDQNDANYLENKQLTETSTKSDKNAFKSLKNNINKINTALKDTKLIPMVLQDADHFENLESVSKPDSENQTENQTQTYEP